MTAAATRPAPAQVEAPRASALSRSLTASGILRIAAECREVIARGERVANLTVGDFSPAEFRVPQFLADAISDAIHAGETNYPPAYGITPLREAVRALYTGKTEQDHLLRQTIQTQLEAMLWKAFVDIIP